MSRIEGPVITRRMTFGHLRVPMTGGVVVGDRYVPPLIEVDFVGTDGNPSLFMVIEVVDGVPRCTELTFKRVEGGRAIRPLDLSAVQLDDWIAEIVSMCAGELRPHEEEGVTHAVFGSGEDHIRAGMKTINDIRKGSRRPLTADRKKRVAEVYNAQETGGIEAVVAAFGVSRSTAVRYIRAARESGLIEARD